MPRVALFCTNFLPYSQSFVFEELRQHQRYQAEVFAWRRFYPDRFPFSPLHLASKAYIVTRRCRAFDEQLGSGRFNLIHAHFGPGGTYALPFAERHRLPLVVTFHGYDVPLLQSRERWLPLHLPYALRGPELLRKMTLGLCASSELREMLLALGVPQERLLVHRLGIDLDQFRPLDKSGTAVRVLMVGRFVEKKGFLFGLEAFARAARGRDATLTLIGSGPLRARLERRAHELGVGAQISFPGPLPLREVAEALGRAHVLLAPSVVTRTGNRESGLLVVKEASACETVPVGTRHGGIPEIIDHGETGYLVPERDIEALATSLSELMQSPERRLQLARRARLKMEREYDNRERVLALESIYDRVAV